MTQTPISLIVNEEDSDTGSDEVVDAIYSGRGVRPCKDIRPVVYVRLHTPTRKRGKPIISETWTCETCRKCVLCDSSLGVDKQVDCRWCDICPEPVAATNAPLNVIDAQDLLALQNILKMIFAHAAAKKYALNPSINT